MWLKRRARASVIRKFKKDLKEYPYVFPYYQGRVNFNTFNHQHLCLARMCGVEAFEQVCRCTARLKEDKYSSIGHEDYCDNCKYDIRVDFFCAEEGGEPELRLACDERLIGYIRKGFYEDYSNKSFMEVDKIC